MNLRYVLALTDKQYNELINRGLQFFFERHKGSPIIYYTGRDGWTNDPMRAKTYRTVEALKASARRAFERTFIYAANPNTISRTIEYTIATMELNNLKSESQTINL